LITWVEGISEASFRDPAGYVYRDNGVSKRIVTTYGEEDYQQLISSGLYEQLVEETLLVRHEEQPVAKGSHGVAILVPEQIPYISYPYEWCFGQLRDAALLTLRIQEVAMEYGMSLKDASAFNVQFRGAQPVFIDTLSFERNLGGPWVAYNQFCRHFLAPLLLMSEVSADFNHFWRASLDGFPLALASSLLPKRTYFKPGVLLHIHLHARMQRKYAEVTKRSSPEFLPSGNDRKLTLVASLRDLVGSIKPDRFETEWRHYYDRKATHYSSLAEESKKKAVEDALDQVNPGLLYDLGGNVGEYSRLAAGRGVYTICFDIDPLCVHDNYERAHSEGDQHMLPLMLDLTNPSPALGLALRERGSLLDRGHADLTLALALVHHLRVTGNMPFRHIAAFLSQMTDFLLIEYVPKTDGKVQALLSNRKDTFFDYTASGFLGAFQPYFEIVRTFPVAETDRVLYLYRNRKNLA
jgi:hypothetical protein